MTVSTLPENPGRTQVRRSRLAGEGGVSGDIFRAAPPHSPASRLLQVESDAACTMEPNREPPNSERRTPNRESRITINDEPARIRPTFFIGRQSAEHHPTALPKPDADFTVLAATCFENDLVAGLKKRTHLAVGQRDGVFSAIGHFQQAAELAWLRA
jgi:hypothetical protein